MYLPVLQRDEPVHGRGKPSSDSYILSINPGNGKTIWKHTRPSNAKKESLESFGTIIPHENQLIIAGGDVITGHDPKSGDEIWRWGTWNPGHKQEWWRLVPSPVFGDGVFLVCAPKKSPIFAVKEVLSVLTKVISVYGGIQCNKVILPLMCQLLFSMTASSTY